MTKRSLTSCLSAVSVASMLALTSGSALALPPIFDRVPTGMAVVIVIPSIDQLGKDISGLGTLVGAGEGFNAKDMIESLPGGAMLDTKGAVAIVLPEIEDSAAKKAGAAMGGGDSKDEPKGVALIQVTDYDAMVKAGGGTPTAGVDKITHEGEDLFMKKVDGGFAAISDDKALLEKMNFPAGQMAAHVKAAGKRGDELSATGDLVIMVDMAKMRPQIDAGIKEMEQQVEDMAAMGGQAPNTAAAKWFVDAVVADATTATLTMDISDAGIGLHAVAAFKEGSRMAKLGAVKGSASGMTARLPMGPYLALLAADMSNAELRKMLGEIPADKNMPGAAAQEATNKLMLEKSTGAAMMVGVNPGGPMAGILARCVNYTFTSDPAGYIAAMKGEVAKSLEDSKLATATYKADAAEIGGTKVMSYDIKMTPSEEVPQQAMQMIFGMSGGPSGYIHAMDGGVVSTIGKSSDLMGAAMKAFAKGEGSVGDNGPLMTTAKMMPKDRMAEVFIGTKGLLDSLLPMAAMFTGTPLNVEVPESVAPIGLAIAPAGDAMQASIVIPASVIKTGSDVAKAFQAAQGGAGEPDEMQPEPEKKDSSKPKF